MAGEYSRKSGIPAYRDAGRTGRIGALLRAALLGGAIVGAGAAGVGASPSPETEKREPAEPRALVLPGQDGFAFGLLGSFEIRTPAHRFQEQWNELLRRVEDERSLYGNCADAGSCAPKHKAWRALVGELEGLPQREQMERVNRAVNRLVTYTDDTKAYGKRDHWATPLESLKRGGDCEDYAILKFVTLLELGFDSGQLRMAIVRDRRRGLMHAVLSVKLDGRTYILDNLNGHAVEHQHVLKYVPLYSATLDAQWVHVVTPQIRARFVTHVMQGGGEEAGPQQVSLPDRKPALNGEERVSLIGDYATSWT